VVTSEQVMHGLGKHMRDLSDDDITITLQVSITERLQSRLHDDLSALAKACLARPNDWQTVVDAFSNRHD
jgi:hypothetical protein